MTNARYESRLCERCWRPIPPGTPCGVERTPDPARAPLGVLHRHWHLDNDPACTGTQLNTMSVLPWWRPLHTDPGSEPGPGAPS
ncbi:MAG: hypothetical protein M3235_12850 [Actinomycetota bacterium]|nr:hypothetical protein [Actinomycetota bacterium]